MFVFHCIHGSWLLSLISIDVFIWLFYESCSQTSIFRCDSISQHLPLSVGESVSQWVIVSDLEIALGACSFATLLLRNKNSMQQSLRWSGRKVSIWGQHLVIPNQIEHRGRTDQRYHSDGISQFCQTTIHLQICSRSIVYICACMSQIHIYQNFRLSGSQVPQLTNSHIFFWRT